MKRILIFSTAYFPFVGGAEIAVKEITDRLLDFEFDMITAKMDRNLKNFEHIGNVNVYRIGFGTFFDKYLLPILGYVKAVNLNKQRNYLNIWSIMASFGGFAALFFKKKNRKIPFLLTLQEGDSPEYIKKRVGIFYPLFKKIFTNADHIQGISNFLKNWAIQIGATCPIDVVPNGVDIDKFKVQISKLKADELKDKLGIKENEMLVVTTSRLVKKNGVEDLITAMNYLPKNFKLLIIGGGELESNFKFQISNFKLQDRVIMLGAIKPEEIPPYLSVSDVFCRPSLSEGLGNSFLEAMAAGLPVIGTPVGGIPDFLKDGFNGYFVRINDPADIAEKIYFILDQKNKEIINTLISNAKKTITDKYEWKIISAKMEKIFNYAKIT